VHEAIGAVRPARKARTLRKSAPDTQANGRAAAGFLSELGREVRRGRAKRGMTRRQLAHASHTSERYLAQIESGTGNPSVAVLRAIAQALDIPAANLLGEPAAHSGARAALLDVVAQLPDQSLAELTQLIEARFLPPERDDRAGRIALVGLRGAGKSTLGRRLAERLGVPFVEMAAAIAEESGTSLSEIFSLYGQAAYRRYERRALERAVAAHEAAVIATGGSLVSEAGTFELLLRSCHTIWVAASPAEHMGRVMAQGDLRPMQASREAMADLKRILDTRRALYGKAAAVVDTTARSIDDSFASLLDAAQRLLRP
jgi:XRE family transcriptional regulator, aerobic/anaerobic benzoate catabolism transcriptional regulator